MVCAEHNIGGVEGEVVELGVRGEVCGAGGGVGGDPADGAGDDAGLGYV